SSTGNIFRTTDRGETWNLIGAQGVFGNQQSLAMAFGAPPAGVPSGTVPLNNFIYVGTNNGRVWVTTTGGGVSGNQWVDTTNGALAADGTAVLSIVPSPRAGSRELYAVTRVGVYYLSDSSGGTW